MPNDHEHKYRYAYDDSNGGQGAYNDNCTIFDAHYDFSPLGKLCSVSANPKSAF
jgi:hypothetical protein